MNSKKQKELIGYVSDFWEGKIMKINDYDEYTLYSYSSNRYKFGHSNLLHDIKINNFQPSHFMIWEVMLSRVVQSKDYMDSGMVKFVYGDYREFCSNKTFYQARQVFIDHKLLLPTPSSKYYIISPRHINKFHNIRRFKSDRQIMESFKD